MLLLHYLGLDIDRYDVPPIDGKLGGLESTEPPSNPAVNGVKTGHPVWFLLRQITAPYVFRWPQSRMEVGTSLLEKFGFGLGFFTIVCLR